MLELALIFTLGIAASPRCAAACGRAARAMQQFPAADHGLSRQLLYNTGRVLGYLLLGAAGGALGAAVLAQQPIGRVTPSGFDQHMLSVVAGGLMILMAWQLFGRPWVIETRGAEGLLRFVPRIARSRSRIGPLLLGLLAALVPCPLVCAFLALAARTANPDAGMAVMLAFGLGTVPLMLAITLADDKPEPDRGPTAIWHRVGTRVGAWTRPGVAQRTGAQARAETVAVTDSAAPFVARLVLLLGVVTLLHGVLGPR